MTWGAALEFLINPLEHVGAFEMFVMLALSISDFQGRQTFASTCSKWPH
jgi:hypothetical protein